MKPNKTLEITKPSNQLKLFGYEKYFSLLSSIAKKKGVFFITFGALGLSHIFKRIRVLLFFQKED